MFRKFSMWLKRVLRIKTDEEELHRVADIIAASYVRMFDENPERFLQKIWRNTGLDDLVVMRTIKQLLKEGKYEPIFLREHSDKVKLWLVTEYKLLINIITTQVVSEEVIDKLIAYGFFKDKSEIDNLIKFQKVSLKNLINIGIELIDWDLVNKFQYYEPKELRDLSNYFESIKYNPDEGVKILNDLVCNTPTFLRSKPMGSYNEIAIYDLKSDLMVHNREVTTLANYSRRIYGKFGDEADSMLPQWTPKERLEERKRIKADYDEFLDLCHRKTLRPNIFKDINIMQRKILHKLYEEGGIKENE